MNCHAFPPSKRQNQISNRQLRAQFDRKLFVSNIVSTTCLWFVSFALCNVIVTTQRLYTIRYKNRHAIHFSRGALDEIRPDNLSYAQTCQIIIDILKLNLWRGKRQCGSPMLRTFCLFD